MAISRREFLKISGFGIAVSAQLAGVGFRSSEISRQFLSEFPGLTFSTPNEPIATTCGQCSAGCGLLMRKTPTGFIQMEGNPDHPVNRGEVCSRGRISLKDLFDPGRMKGPLHQVERGSGNFEGIDWESALRVVEAALRDGGIAFLMGLFPDHLYDLVEMIANAAGTTAIGMSALRYGILGEFEGRVTLMDAAQKLFGVSKIPYFDLQQAAVTFSFGANFTETWISPVAYNRQYHWMRQGYSGQPGYLVQFEPRRSQTAAAADEWIPIKPGTEALVASTLARLVDELHQGTSFRAFNTVEIASVAQESGVSEADLNRLARLFAGASRKLAIPGGIALGSTNGLAAAEAILALNILANNLGQDGGLYFTPDPLVHPELVHRSSTFAEIKALVERMRNGQINTLFVHGANPVYDLPAELGFMEALKSVPQVISFASFLDETAALADYVLPDHTPLESWGYQKVVTGSDRLVVSGLQPVIAPRCNTRATTDVLLAAIQAVGGNLAAAVPFHNEVDFLQKSAASLMGQGGFYDGADVVEFWSRWKQHGGWWKANAGLSKPEVPRAFKQPVGVELAHYAGDDQEYPFYLLIYPYSGQVQASAGRSSERPGIFDPPTSTDLKTWVEIHPSTAQGLGVREGDIVKLSSPFGEMEARVSEYPATRPDVVAVPLWQAGAASGCPAEQRGGNPVGLLGVDQNNSGDLAFMGTRVKVSPAGRCCPSLNEIIEST